MSNPAVPALTALAHLLVPFGGTATAIICFTLLVRLALHPLTRAAVRGEKARARLAPRVAELQRKHKGDVRGLSTATAELYRAERISPMAGIGPMLVQIPVVFLLYRALRGDTFGAARIDGVPLADRFLTSAGGLGAHVLVFGVLFAALTAVAICTSIRTARLTRMPTAAAPPPGRAKSATDTPATGAAAIMNSPAMLAIGRYAPFLVLISAVVLPLGAGLYLLTTTAWTAAENALLRRGVPVSAE